ncbi:MAG: hypothetical protein R2698_12675 [Microthrixaceae bacterium]
MSDRSIEPGVEALDQLVASGAVGEPPHRGEPIEMVVPGEGGVQGGFAG